jgi:hypothetical protein
MRHILDLGGCGVRRVLTVTLTVAVAAVGCGGSDQRQAEDAAKAAAAKSAAAQATAAKGTEQGAKTAEEGAKQAAQGLEAMAKGLEAMASGGAGGTNAVTPVSFRDLQTFFPDLDGWEKEKPTGERMTSPFAFSQAEVRYAKGDAQIEMKLVDSGFNQLLFTPFAMMMQAGYEKETQSGYEKSTTVAGMPGWEKWDTEGKDGSVNALVGKRFLLSVEGSNVPDVQALHAIAAKIDMNKLAALK